MSLLEGLRVRVRAPAKVNLTLRILERMPDGFHRLETLFQAVDLQDTLALRVTEGDAVRLETPGTDLGPPADNLVVQAVHAFRRATGRVVGLRIRLEKAIPAGAGLGGGSSDAGAILRALNLIHGGPLDADGLQSVGATLGADVAFFAGEAGYALGEGRGERLRPLPPLPRRTLLLGLPPVHVATGPAYGALARERADSDPPPPVLLGDVPGDWAAVRRVAVNDFEAVVPGMHPPVAGALDALRAEGAPMALLSGSGGAVFGLPWAPEPETCLSALRGRAPDVRWVAASTLERLPPPHEVDRTVRKG